MFIDVFEEQNAILDGRHPRRTDQMRQHGQIAAPENAFDIDALRIQLCQPDAMGTASQATPEIAHRGGADVFKSKVRADRRAGKTGAAVTEQPHLQRREVAMADEEFFACYELGKIDIGQQPRYTVPTAQGDDDVNFGVVGRCMQTC